jgi:N-acetylglucosamine-6-phosphate deacetylase
MAQAAANICAVADHPELKGHIIGSHMEGPYLSVSQAGAQPPAHITAPVKEDYLPLMEQYGHSIARWTYAPENDPEGIFADALKDYGVVASAGHTDAIYSQMKNAMAHGCNLITHLYSCTSTVTREYGFRRPGVIETAWLEDDLYVEIIAAGKHLPAQLLRMICKIKGSDKILLCTDSMSVAGCDMTEGRLQDIEFIIEDGVCKLQDRSAFAGSIATADRLVRVMVQEADVSVPEAVKMLTEVPARVMGLDAKGKLAKDYDADILVFDDDIRIQNVFVDGKCVV